MTWGRFGVTLRYGQPLGLVSSCERTKGADVNKPDWDKWNKKAVELWQAVALSLDVNPNDQTVIDALGLDGLHHRNSETKQDIRIEPAESDHDQILAMRERLRVALDRTAGLTYRGDPFDDNDDWRENRMPLQWNVFLTDFAELALRRGWTLPERFPRPYRGGDGNVTVTTPYTTKKLDSLFEIMREFWTTYDPKNPPKSGAIGQAIDKAIGYKPTSSEKPSRQADTLAALIRPDALGAADKRAKVRRK